MNDSNSQNEQPSTYIVQDRSNQEELTRLQTQDQMATREMGGVLSEQTDPDFRRVLDVGCGTGGWLIEVARSYPQMETGIGVDASHTLVKAARQAAQTASVENRVTFQVMDALRMLEFPDRYFDLVNQRFGQSWLRTWDWQKLLQEYKRVTRPGGVIRVTEGNIGVESNSPTLTRLYELGLSALEQSGHLFGQKNEHLNEELTCLFERHGIQQVQTREYISEYSGETPARQYFIEDMRQVFRTTLPFLRKWTRVPDNYEDLYQQMLSEIQRPDFVAHGRMMTIWGINLR